MYVGAYRVCGRFIVIRVAEEEIGEPAVPMTNIEANAVTDTK
jgi:hypothetical protein